MLKATRQLSNRFRDASLASTPFSVSLQELTRDMSFEYAPVLSASTPFAPVSLKEPRPPPRPTLLHQIAVGAPVKEAPPPKKKRLPKKKPQPSALEARLAAIANLQNKTLARCLLVEEEGVDVSFGFPTILSSVVGDFDPLSSVAVEFDPPAVWPHPAEAVIKPASPEIRKTRIDLNAPPPKPPSPPPKPPSPNPMLEPLSPTSPKADGPTLETNSPPKALIRMTTIPGLSSPVAHPPSAATMVSPGQFSTASDEIAMF